MNYDYDCGHVYIVEIDKFKKIYKIDTTNDIKIKNAKPICERSCMFIDNAKNNLINIFSKKFSKCSKGKDYFIGDIDKMILEMNLFIDDFTGLCNKAANAVFQQNLNLMFKKNDSGCVSLSEEEFNKLIDVSRVSRNANDELYEFNIIEKHKNFEKNKDNLSIYDNAIYLIYQVLIDCVEHDKENGDYYSEENNKKIRKAGELLNSHGGFDSMRDTLLLQVPKRYRRDFDLVWDGIGKWRG